ncbi:hypothetical protein CDIK_3394 [Cucumispora dikerogammari]|nr:hypothetical protein CDIK_3394 [Cucumispora dikerogammari]
MFYIYSKFLNKLSYTNNSVYCSFIQPKKANPDLSVIEESNLYENVMAFENEISYININPIVESKETPTTHNNLAKQKIDDDIIYENEKKPHEYCQQNRTMTLTKLDIHTQKIKNKNQHTENCLQRAGFCYSTHTPWTKREQSIKTYHYKTPSALPVQHKCRSCYINSTSNCCAIDNTSASTSVERQEISSCGDHEQTYCSDYHSYEDGEALFIPERSVQTYPRGTIPASISSFSSDSFDNLNSAVSVDLRHDDRINKSLITQNTTISPRIKTTPLSYYRERDININPNHRVARTHLSFKSLFKNKKSAIIIGTCVYMLVVLMCLFLYLFYPWTVHTVKVDETTDIYFCSNRSNTELQSLNQFNNETTLIKYTDNDLRFVRYLIDHGDKIIKSGVEGYKAIRYMFRNVKNFNDVLIAYIHDNPEHKEGVCKTINKLIENMPGCPFIKEKFFG